MIPSLVPHKIVIIPESNCVPIDLALDATSKSVFPSPLISRFPRASPQWSAWLICRFSGISSWWIVLASLLVRRPSVPGIIVIDPVRMNVPDPSAGAPMTRSILESPLKSPVVRTEPHRSKASLLSWIPKLPWCNRVDFWDEIPFVDPYRIVTLPAVSYTHLTLPRLE